MEPYEVEAILEEVREQLEAAEIEPDRDIAVAVYIYEDDEEPTIH